jgi:hypothetical protein
MSVDPFGFDSQEQNDYANLFSGDEPSNSDILDKYVRLPQGEAVLSVRLLPKAQDGPLFQETRVHTIIVNGQRRNIHCPRKKVQGSRGTIFVDEDKNKPCPICVRYQKLWEQSKAVSPEQAKELQNEARKIKPKQKFYWNAIIRKQVDPKTKEVQHNVGPKILSVGEQIQAIISQAYTGNPKIEQLPLGNVCHWKDGRDLKIIGTPQGPYTLYNNSKFAEPSVLGSEAEMKEWASKLHDLKSLRRILPHEEAVKMFNESVGGSSEGANKAPIEGVPMDAGFPSSFTSSKSSSKSLSETSLADLEPDDEFKDDFNAL